MKKIFLQLHGTGLINQLMAIEIAAGISAEEVYDVTVHNIVQDPTRPIYNLNVNNLKRIALLSKKSPTIIDLIDYDDRLGIKFEETNLSLNADNLFGPHYYSGSKEDLSEKEIEFACNRININSFSSDKNYLAFANLWYSTFFFNRSKEINNAIKSVKFKKEYYDLAKKIADSIGSFSGAHIRLTDHAFWKTEITSQKIDSYLEKINSDQIVIATDDFDSKIITGISKKNIILDKYIEENFMQEFLSLEFCDESVFGLVVNLVMHNSKDFVSSQGSTYSGYIHRNVNQNHKINDWKIIGEENPFPGKHYSFSNYAEKDLMSWYREWPESYMEEE